MAYGNIGFQYAVAYHTSMYWTFNVLKNVSIGQVVDFDKVVDALLTSRIFEYVPKKTKLKIMFANGIFGNCADLVCR